MKVSGEEGTNTGKPRKVTVCIEKTQNQNPRLYIFLLKNFFQRGGGRRKERKEKTLGMLCLSPKAPTQPLPEHPQARDLNRYFYSV